MATTTPTDTDTLIRLPEVIQKTGLSRMSVYRLMKAGTFPASRKLMGPGRRAPIGWSANEVQAWIEERKNANTAAVA
ncbi:helix-turn-helix transcriptional regulator [Pseudomonas leptonychotis]|uniref:helix-turn-helix transcriptional regulator n=1 Tax=Pseudomonas leptonychotis TaxID=2448482 RepID=UPI003866E1D7